MKPLVTMAAFANSDSDSGWLKATITDFSMNKLMNSNRRHSHH